MPCCLQNSFVPQTQSRSDQSSRQQITFFIAVEEEKLPLIFSYIGSYNAQPVELKASLYPIGEMKFLGIEAGLQISNTGKPGPYEGKYAGKAMFEKQIQLGSLEARKPWLSLLLALFPGDI